MERPLILTPDDLRPVRELYERALYLQAYERAQNWGPLSQWQGTAARVMAARLISHLGSVRLSNWLIRCAWKEDRTDPEATYYFAYRTFAGRGPYDAWQWMKQRPELGDDATDDLRSSWCALAADTHAALRDFDAAEHWLDRADTIHGQNPWVMVSRARVLELQDRYDEALASAQRALQCRAWYRPAVQAASHLLTLLGRDSEAMSLMTSAVQQMESGTVEAQLFALQLELRQFAEAGATLDRIERLWPLIEKQGKQWLAAQRAEVAYHLGDIDGAICFADESKSEFFKQVAINLKQPERANAPVVSLPVGFVRQHHVTCGPATLASISRYWSMPVDHLQLAEEICYDGTSAHSERLWADQHGWFVREFSVTEASAADLIQRGIPFTLTTIEPANSHLQAVIGYDGRRGVLIIRDPYYRTFSEALAEKTLERYRAFGPRGMALVPMHERARLEAVNLPDVPLWDLLFQLDAALIAHRRDDAQAILQQLTEKHPEHRLTIDARRRLAGYDNNLHERIAAVEQLHHLFPDNQNITLEQMSLLRDVARRDERLQRLADLCRQKDAHPLYWQQYAQELRLDARRHEEAVWLLRRAIRRWPSHAANYYILGNIYWDQRRYEEALELYRFAACLDDKDEQFVRAYFLAAKWFKRTDEALAWLRSRCDRFGKKSSHPARTLFTSLCQMDRTTEALEVLEKAIASRPSDGQLQLFAADGYLSCGLHHLQRAQALLEQARGRAPQVEWLRVAARLASADGRLSDALQLWQQVHELEPLAVDAHRSIAQLLAETNSRAAALDYLAALAQRFPHFSPLHDLWIEWTREQPNESRESVIRWVIENNPANAFARRELAFLLADMRRWDEAWQESNEAQHLEPHNPAQHVLRARLLRGQGLLDDAKHELREAIALSVDYDYAISELIDLCDTIAERREALVFVQQQLIAQVIFGDGLLTFRDHARGVLGHEELLQVLRNGLQARPDLWHAWSATLQQLMHMNRLDEAYELAIQATEHFPLLPRLWVDRAMVCRAREEWDAAQESLETAYEINPSWGYVARLLSDMYERAGNLDEARRLLELAISRSPLDSWNHVALADILWRQGDRESAVDRVQHAVQIDPSNDGAWERLQQWCRETEQPERALSTIRNLTKQRSGEARSWILLARALDQVAHTEECLAALDQALCLNARSIEAHDLRAMTFLRAGRWSEARAACAPAAWPQPPVELRGRAAWIEAELGNLDAAISLMNAAVAEDPHYFFGWSRLADWHQHRQEPIPFLRAAEQLVQLSPHHEVSLATWGEALLANEDREAAREAFRRAFDLNPAYEFAGCKLFDMDFDDQQWESAERTLQILLQQHPQSAWVLTRRLQLACQRSDEQEPIDVFRQLCTTHFESGSFYYAVDAMREAGYASAAANVIKETYQSAAGASDAERSPVEPELPRYWVELQTGQQQWDCEHQLRSWSDQGIDVGPAVYAYVHALIQSSRFATLKDFVRDDNHRWLRRWTVAWGAVGYGLAAAHWYPETVQWMADYRERTEAQPWMLVNLVEGLWIQDRGEEALEVSRWALELASDNGKDPHHSWLAAAAALKGHLELAQHHLAAIVTRQDSGPFYFLDVLTESLLAMASAEPNTRSKIYREVRARLATARREFPEFAQEPARQKLYYRTVAEIARKHRTLSSLLWYLTCRWRMPLRWFRS